MEQNFDQNCSDNYIRQSRCRAQQLNQPFTCSVCHNRLLVKPTCPSWNLICLPIIWCFLHMGRWSLIIQKCRRTGSICSICLLSLDECLICCLHDNDIHSAHVQNILMNVQCFNQKSIVKKGLTPHHKIVCYCWVLNHVVSSDAVLPAQIGGSKQIDRSPK